jgi:hypothetical protein
MKERPLSGPRLGQKGFNAALKAPLFHGGPMGVRAFDFADAHFRERLLQSG